jgi:beta-phosphoglucomutase
VPYKAVLFDMDGVILDSEPLHYQAARAVFAERGHDLTYVNYQKYFAGQADKEAFPQYCAVIGRNDAARLMADKAEAYKRVAATTTLTPCPGTLEFIAWLAEHRVPMALVTGSLRHEADLVLWAFQLQNVFSTVISVEDVTHGKPHPEGYLKGAAALLAQPADCVVVEDAPHGIQAAIAAGMRCLAVTTTYPAQQLQAATRVVDQLHHSLLAAF